MSLFGQASHNLPGGLAGAGSLLPNPSTVYQAERLRTGLGTGGLRPMAAAWGTDKICERAHGHPCVSASPR